LRYGATHTRETSPEDVEESKPELDIFEVVLKKLKIDGNDALAIGDSPDDAEAAGKPDVRTIGVLCGGFTESEHRKAGRVDVYPGPGRSVGILRRLFAGEIGSIVAAQIAGSPEAQRAPVAVNEIAILALGLVGAFDDRLPRLAVLVIPWLRGRHFRFSPL
jgi:hypothetical protein